jgi:2-polyprenyl-3-methyl-5-hydroxy-6-metoxy-1,4-benzoquinol methylase
VASSKYDTVVDLGLENNSHTLMVQLVGSNKRVLDVGCANGYLAQVLGERACEVSGVEFDRAAAEEARPHLKDLVVGDLEQLDLVAELGEARFDVLVFGDVLEHLRDPLPVLRQARRLLAPGGYVVISIPNVAHGAVRLTLLQGQFDYRPLGLLDSTHIRFFTRENLKTLLHDAGLAPTDFLRTTAGLFETELGLTPDSVPPDLVEQVLQDPDATTYQFVVRAVPDDADRSVETMRAQFEERLEDAERRIAEAESRLAEEQQRATREIAERDERLTAYHEHVVARDREIARLEELVAGFEGTRAVQVARSAREVLQRVRPTAR